MDNNYWAVLLKINFNLFEGLATKSRVNQANAEILAGRLELEKRRQMIIQDVRGAYNKMSGAAERINTLQRNLSLSEKNLEAAKKQFEMGVITINQVAEYNISLVPICINNRYMIVSWTKGGFYVQESQKNNMFRGRS